MGRGKGRSKGIDVTKHFLHLAGMPTRITVQISPLQFVQVEEEDVSPTQGTEAAFASKREGKAGAQLKLCANWREGACHSHAACSNAHVLAYFNTPALSSIANGVFTARTESLQPREDTDWQQSPFSLQQQQFQSYSQQHQQQQQECSQQVDVSSVSVEPKASETPSALSPASSRVQHSSLIPAPRSQQFRQSISGVSGPTTLLNNVKNSNNNNNNNNGNSNVSWSRKVMGGAATSPHVNQSVRSNSKPSNGRTSINYTNYNPPHQRVGDLSNWGDLRTTVEGGIVDAGLTTAMGAKSPVQGSSVRRGPFNERLGSPAQSSDIGDAWVNPVPLQSAGGAGIWYDTSATPWDAAPEDALRPADAVVGRDSATRRGTLWESFGGGRAATPPEALKQRLLRDLVGAGADAGAPPSPPKSDGDRGSQTAQRGSDVSGLMSLLGGQAKRHSESGSSATSPPAKNLNTVKHLMELLTTE